MASYQIAFVALIMAVQAYAQYNAPSYAAPGYAAPGYKQEEYYAPPKYEFEYAVKDDHTYDIKSQKETREGDYVKGYYTLVQPDGRTRIVEYTSDAKTGFLANVKYEGEAKYPAPAPKYAAAPSYAAPSYSAPSYSRPSYSAPSYSAPSYSAPSYSAPSYSAPSYSKPSYSAPSYSAPSYSAPSYSAAPKYASSGYSSASISTPQYSYKH